ncbi:MAG TPA: hypothetical protein QF764_06885 [Planctomycetota bacterium]|jgi:hypothetical protein|nr:hypothetical protein [Planctomycetota bacterium]
MNPRPWLVVCLSALPSLTSCSVPGFYVAPRYGTSLAVSGSAGITEGVAVPSDENTVAELGIGDNDGYYGGRLGLEMGNVHLLLTTQSSAHAGSGELAVEISDGGVVIPEEAFVDTIFHFGLHELLLTFDLIPEESVSLGLGLGATSLAFDMRIDEMVIDPMDEEVLIPSGQRIRAASDAPVPVIGVRFTAILGRFSLELDLAGMDIDIGGDHLSYMDAGIEATLWLLPDDSRAHFALLGGYRYTSIDLQVDTGESLVDADMTFSGPYIGLGLSF